MKKILSLALLCLSITTSFAQDSEICGTWSGVYNQPAVRIGDNPCPIQFFIRIRKNGQHFRPQVKEVSKTTDYVYYHPKCNITSANDNVISWYEDEPIDYSTANDGTYYSIRNYFEARITNGALCISQTRCILKYYDSNKKFMYEEESSPYKWMNITTYKDDDDW